MRDFREFFSSNGTSALAPATTPGTRKPSPLKVVEDDVYGKLRRRRRKAQMAARRALGVHDDVRRTF